MNEKLIKGLTEIADHYKTYGKYYQQRAFENAAQKIRALKQHVVSSEDLNGIYGIGAGIKARVDDLLSGKYVAQERSGIELLEIRGIGPKTATKLVEQGFTTIEDLKKLPPDASVKLTSSQKLGVEYYEQLKRPIKRAQIDCVKMYLSEIIKRLKLNYTMEIVGSYRRKAEESGDIDILFVDKSAKDSDEGDLSPIVEFLKEENVILGIFGQSSRFFSGILNLDKDSICSIDMKLYSRKSYPFALLYFTGPKRFNIDMRNLAKSLGYKLSDNSLVSEETGKLVKCMTEEDIFKALGLRYIPPWSRVSL